MQKKHYQVDMAAMLQMGKWMDDLREKGVYDNTRIIIVADHGYAMEYPEMMNSELKLDPLAYNPLFMVKDFSDNDELRFSDEFMTNADTPVTAFSGLVENPVNPFTQQPITDLDKGSNEQKVCDSPFNISVNNGYTFADSHYYVLKNHEVLNPENWSEAK